jgi:hypothetical protein
MYISQLLLNTDDLNNANKTFKFMYVCIYVSGERGDPAAEDCLAGRGLP